MQSPELTVRETILYSAMLRLDNDAVKSDDEKVAFVSYLMKTLELLPFADSLVGTSESGGLSFEQKKRLSIAVELAASPSIIFLDEVCIYRVYFLLLFFSDSNDLTFFLNSQQAASTQEVR